MAPVLAPHELATAWNGDPLTVLALLAVAGLYARGLVALRRARPAAAPLARWRVRAFAAGWLVLFAALVSPLHALGHTLLTAHMLQHLLLMVAAPPLLIAGRPAVVSPWALPEPHRERLRSALRTLRRWPWRSAAAAIAVSAAHLGILWGWHVPWAYEAALRSQVVHALEHLTMLGVACLLWGAVLRRGVLRYGAGVLALTVTAAAGGALAALLTFSERPWYGLYDPMAAGWPLSALDDQHLAGALMWVAGGLAYAAAAAVLFVWWLRALERRADRRGRRPSLPARGLLVVAAAAALAACQPDVDPGEEEGATVARGREALVEYGCIACHAVEGIRAPQGRVGPSLHDIAQRETLAGELPNTPDNLARWILEPQEIDPGNIMPDLGVTTRDAESIMRYLDALE